MKKTSPKLLSGFMELLPAQQIAFNNMKNTIAQTYEKFGFMPMDTPVLESADVLLAKAGGETEKQIYRFEKGDNDIALRFDLTVPLARFVAANQNNLAFPFRRYQIGKVYRGERPQKGRFREFYQCDIDIVGNEKLDIIYEAEVAAVIIETLKALNIGDFVMNISNRKLLSGLLQGLGIEDKATDVLRIIDKLDKVGGGGMIAMLLAEGIGLPQANAILGFCNIKGSAREVIENLKAFGIANDIFNAGISELAAVVSGLENFGIPEKFFAINLSIARGLDYYTGTVYETFLVGKENVGSIASGGRYDNLASAYTDKTLPGVGICIGLTRLFDILRANEMLDFSKTLCDVLVIPMSPAQIPYAINVANFFRKNNIKTEVFFEDVKFKNKMNYANKSQIPFAVILGEDEEKSGIITLKNMKTSTQITCPPAEAIENIKK
ncbi:MAG: histidine--tRNA ligase [Clostridia bacterium]